MTSTADWLELQKLDSLWSHARLTHGFAYSCDFAGFNFSQRAFYSRKIIKLPIIWYSTYSEKGTWFQPTAEWYIDEWNCQCCKVIYSHEPPDEIFCIQICASHLSLQRSSGGRGCLLIARHTFLCLFLLYSSFDEYTAEVKSGRLEWSPVHKSEKFWVSGSM